MMKRYRYKKAFWTERRFTISKSYGVFLKNAFPFKAKHVHAVS